jgi:hypothetical protein
MTYPRRFCCGWGQPRPTLITRPAETPASARRHPCRTTCWLVAKPTPRMDADKAGAADAATTGYVGVAKDGRQVSQRERDKPDLRSGTHRSQRSERRANGCAAAARTICLQARGRKSASSFVLFVSFCEPNFGVRDKGWGRRRRLVCGVRHPEATGCTAISGITDQILAKGGC